MTESKNNELIDVPKKGADKLIILKKLYDDVSNDYTKEQERFDAANKFITEPLSHRGWFRAKIKWQGISILEAEEKIHNIKSKAKHKEKAEKIVTNIKDSKKPSSTVPNEIKKHIREKPDRNLFKEVQGYINKTIDIPILDTRPKKNYTDDEKKIIIETIFETYSHGVSNLIKLCQAQGIEHNIFHQWIDSNNQWRKDWEKVQKQHVLSFIRVFKEFYKEEKLKEMFTDEDVYWTINYTFVPSINPETKNAEMQMIPTSAIKHVRPRKLDNTVQNIFIEGMKDMYALETASEMTIASEYDNMSLEEIEKLRQELVDELNIKDSNYDD